MNGEPELLLALVGIVVGYALGRPSNVREAQVRKVRHLGDGSGDHQRYRVELSVDLPERSGKRLHAGRQVKLLLR